MEKLEEIEHTPHDQVDHFREDSEKLNNLNKITEGKRARNKTQVCWLVAVYSPLSYHM